MTTWSNLIIGLVLVALAASSVLATVPSLPTFAPIRSGATKNTVALTINVYLGGEYVEQMMGVLQTYGVTATFFLGGCWVVKHPDVGRKLVQNGFCVGSHGYSHLDHSALNYAQNVAEMNKAKAAIDGACGCDVTLFAPPSGAYNDSTLQAAHDLGYALVLWSKDAIDWRDQEVDSILRRTTQDKGDSEIILLHPTAATVAALPLIIESYLAAGYTFVTAADMAGR